MSLGQDSIRVCQNGLGFFWVLFVKALVVSNSWDVLHGLFDVDLSSLFSLYEDHSQEHFVGPQNMGTESSRRVFFWGGSKMCEIFGTF